MLHNRPTGFSPYDQSVHRPYSAPQPYMPHVYDHRRDVIPEVAHRAYDYPAAAQPADMREQFLMDTLNRMMSELQGIKDQDQLCLGTPTRLLHIQVSSFTTVSRLHTSLMEETITMHLPLTVSLTAVCTLSILVSAGTHKPPLQCLCGQPITYRHICHYILIFSMIPVHLHMVHLHSRHQSFSERFRLVEGQFYGRM